MDHEHITLHEKMHVNKTCSYITSLQGNATLVSKTNNVDQTCMRADRVLSMRRKSLYFLTGRAYRPENTDPVD